MKGLGVLTRWVRGRRQLGHLCLFKTCTSACFSLLWEFALILCPRKRMLQSMSILSFKLLHIFELSESLHRGTSGLGGSWRVQQLWESCNKALLLLASSTQGSPGSSSSTYYPILLLFKPFSIYGGVNIQMAEILLLWKLNWGKSFNEDLRSYSYFQYDHCELCGFSK